LQGQRNLQAETELIFGPPPVNRRVRMMVTLDSDCANDPARVRHMLLRGMNIARINCAHDGPPEWARMIGHLRAAQNETGLACRVAMDLGGPKARTAQLLQSKGHLVKPGDTLLLVPQTSPHSPYPVQVACSLPEILPQLRVGAQVWFDDGLIGTVITAQAEDGWLLTVTQAAEEGDKLKADKGINFPDTHLQLDPLTAKDLADLDFVVAQADMVNYSFVQTAQDVARLEAEIEKRRPGSSLGLVAKIETRAAVENLPAIIAAASSQRPLAIMIARGDLAVEIGFERLAEMQEEILWICEAAHTPVIWATQVLENLAKHGRPSRAEMTDAAMSERAECVMLNKGRYILEAISTLDQVLERMQDHQSKKSAQLRALKSW
jgi:pyruvate kinase